MNKPLPLDPQYLGFRVDFHTLGNNKQVQLHPRDGHTSHRRC